MHQSILHVSEVLEGRQDVQVQAEERKNSNTQR